VSAARPPTRPAADRPAGSVTDDDDRRRRQTPATVTSIPALYTMCRRATNNINNNNNRIVFIVFMSSRQPLREFIWFIWWMQTKRRVTTNRRPTQATWTVSLPKKADTIRIHHCHLLLLSPKGVARFTVSWKVEGRVDLGSAVRVCSRCPRCPYTSPAAFPTPVPRTTHTEIRIRCSVERNVNSLPYDVQSRPVHGRVCVLVM